MEVDRLADFEFDDEEEQPVAPTGGVALNDHVRNYDPIKAGLVVIRQNVAAVEELRDRDRKTANEATRKQIMKELDGLMSRTSGKAKEVKNLLDQIKRDNLNFSKDNKDSAKTQMRVNLYQVHIRKFHEVMDAYKVVSHDFKKVLEARTRRQLKIVDENLSSEAVENIIQSGKASKYIEQAIVNPEDLEDTVRDIEERHMDILKLEESVLEVYELFRDLATLVDMQQETLDVIENRVTTAKDYIEKGEVKLRKAEVQAKKSRRTQCCIMITLLAILVAILLPTLVSVLSNA